MNLKDVILTNKIHQYKIAEIMKISEFTLSRWLRNVENLPEPKKNKIEQAIKIILKNRLDNLKEILGQV